MVSNVKKKQKFERFGNLKPREENLSRNFVVVTNSNSPNGNNTANLNDSIFDQTGGLSYNPADTGLYLQSLTQIPRNQTFSAEALNGGKRNYMRKTNNRIFKQIKGMATDTSKYNSPNCSNHHPMSTSGTLDQMLDTKNLLVQGSDILMSAETRDVSKKLKTSFSNALQDDSLDLTPI